MKTAIVIPARLESTRLPRKLLLSETGKTLIEHTHIAATSSKLAQQIVVATDSTEIVQVVERFGGNAMMTAVDHQSGSDRVAEVAQQLNADIIINLQGDEPEVDGGSIDRLVQTLVDSEDVAVATLATPIRSKRQLYDPSCVKVVFDHHGRANYFSRSAIPRPRDLVDVDKYFPDDPTRFEARFFQHIGIYGYRREFLLQIPGMTRSNAEKIESLEQLRFLAHGWHVAVEVIEQSGPGIDTAEDYALFVNRCGNG